MSMVSRLRLRSFVWCEALCVLHFTARAVPTMAFMFTSRTMEKGYLLHRCQGQGNRLGFICNYQYCYLYNPALQDQKGILGGSDFEDDDGNARLVSLNTKRKLEKNSSYSIKKEDNMMVHTRRKIFRDITACAAAVVTIGTIAYPSDGATNNMGFYKNNNKVASKINSVNANSNSSNKDATKKLQKSLQSIDIKKSLEENKVNVTLVKTLERDLTDAEVYIDRKLFTKIQRRVYPAWIPPIFRQSPVPVREVTDVELLVSGICAGSFTEIFRTLFLYPLTTIKSRIQASGSKYSGNNDAENNNTTNTRLNNSKNKDKKNKNNHWERNIKFLTLSFQRRFSTRKLYAGIIPTLLVSVPASGVYFGIRDVTKRQLTRALATPSKQDDIVIALVGALIGDIICLAVRTPALTYSLRRQVATGNADTDDDSGGEGNESWWKDSWGQLPSVIITDLPYLLLRIALNLTLSNGNEGIGQYELVNISVACFCALVTTPFDVARTRILVDSDGDPTNGLDGGSGESVWITIRNVMEEGKSGNKRGGNGGIRNLYAGWLERILYFGIGSAWLDPIRVLGYLGIRDAVLLEWFD